MNWLRRLLGIRRRVSTKLTPRYEARRIRELRKARELFATIPDGGVRRHQQEGN